MHTHTGVVSNTPGNTVVSVTGWQYQGMISVALAPGSYYSLDYLTNPHRNRFSKCADRTLKHSVMIMLQKTISQFEIIWDIHLYNNYLNFIWAWHLNIRLTREKILNIWLKSTIHLCMDAVGSRTKQSKKWTPGVLTDAEASPQNMWEVHLPTVWYTNQCHL